MKKGILFVVSAPSGSGKGTILREVSSVHKNMKILVSATTRAPRPGEVDGIDYYFLKRSEFLKKIEAGEMLEYDEHFSNYYGTLKTEVESSLNKHEIVVSEVEVNGARAISKAFDCVKVFIVPPSFEVLKKRLLSRETESSQSLQERLDRACFEIKNAITYDYIIVNDDLKSAVSEFNSIINAERQKSVRFKCFLNNFF